MAKANTLDQITEGISHRIHALKRRFSGNKDVTKELHQLENDLKNFAAEISSDIKKLDQTKAEKSELQSKVYKLEQRVKKLETDNKLLRIEKEKITKRLALGQVTFLFEQDLARFVLPEDANPGYFDAYNFMQNELDNCKNNDKKRGKDRLIKALSLPKTRKLWKSRDRLPNEYWDTIKKIRHYRNVVAHQEKVDLDDARLQVSELTPEHKKRGLYIIEVVERVNGLMKLGKLACQFEEDVVNFVFPENPSKNIQEMLKWLTENAELERAKNPKIRWEYLRREIAWKNRYDNALDKLKTLKRDSSILQDVKLSTAKNYISDFVSDDLTNQCNDIIDIMYRLNRPRLGILASEFQDNVIKYVIPDGDQTDIAGMRHWLEETRETSEGIEANTRWEELTDEIIWTDDHDKALSKMIDLKGDITISQSVQADIAKILIIDFVSEEFRQQGFDIIKVFSKLEEVDL